MGDVRNILRGRDAMNDVMSQSHPAPDNQHPHSPTSSDPWRWTEYKSKYRPFSQYSYSGGSWHRNQPLDATDGPSSWYAEVAERIHKAEEYKTRSRSSGIGETDYPSERNRLIWSNSVSALTLHDTVDSAAGYRRQKSRFHSLGPAFSLTKDSKPSLPASAGGGAARTISKPRTSRSVSRRRVADGGKPPPQGASPTKSTTLIRTPSKTPPKKDGEPKDGTKDSKPRAVVKPTPAKEDKAKQDDKKWIKPSTNDTIEKEKEKDKSPPAATSAPKETKPAAPTPIAQTTSNNDKPAELAKSENTKPTPVEPPVTDKQNVPVRKEEPAKPESTNPEEPAKTIETPMSAGAVEPPKTAAPAVAPPAKAAASAASAASPVPAAPPAASATPANAPKAAQSDVKPIVPVPPASTSSATPAAAATLSAPSAAPHSASAPAPAAAPPPAIPSQSTVTSAAAVPIAQQKPAPPIDPMAQSFIDPSTIGGGGGIKAAPKPGDFSLARSRLDEFWAEGK
ncbi:flocculation protein FLO11-like [Varroa jacobsoni]|uniref:flocculation protein FLO11-like n=1 Tax=Varroa jacobsoni TaxID=62625 RepID=UPI000BF8C805|nr:flocculation protein FLO11-like [Varroa jacobsoni]XP_022703711.1 flocculation protein FLO11-like [Varroa jacobsoni]XP_022703712.1 flocculation protein FLO11-like [Varroa jacobsoni]XP_022703713.1 flocculation protein FLO11-like [Varroa jacobsoni]XP_022703714.1 flocculation protein FLO11-like [Varroa jacobsoni]